MGSGAAMRRCVCFLWFLTLAVALLAPVKRALAHSGVLDQWHRDSSANAQCASVGASPVPELVSGSGRGVHDAFLAYYNGSCGDLWNYAITSCSGQTGTGTASGTYVCDYKGTRSGHDDIDLSGAATAHISCSGTKVLSAGGQCLPPVDAACDGSGPETTRVTIYGGRLNDLYGTDEDIKDVWKRVRESSVNVGGCRYSYDPAVTDPDMKCSHSTEGIVDLRVYCELTLKRDNSGSQDGDITPSDKSEPVCPANTDQGTVNGVPRCLPRSGAPPAPMPLKSTSSVEKADNGDGTYTETITTVAPGGVITIDRVTRDSTTGEVKSGEQTASFQEGTGAGAAESVYSDAEGAGGGIENNMAPIQSHDMGSVFSGALGKSRWWDSSCLEDDSIEIYGQTVLLPWSAMCTPLDVLGRALVVLTLLWGVSFVIKGLK